MFYFTIPYMQFDATTAEYCHYAGCPLHFVRRQSQRHLASKLAFYLRDFYSYSQYVIPFNFLDAKKFDASSYCLHDARSSKLASEDPFLASRLRFCKLLYSNLTPVTSLASTTNLDATIKSHFYFPCQTTLYFQNRCVKHVTESYVGTGMKNATNRGKCTQRLF